MLATAALSLSLPGVRHHRDTKRTVSPTPSVTSSSLSVPFVLYCGFSTLTIFLFLHSAQQQAGISLGRKYAFKLYNCRFVALFPSSQFPAYIMGLGLHTLAHYCTHSTAFCLSNKRKKRRNEKKRICEPETTHWVKTAIDITYGERNANYCGKKTIMPTSNQSASPSTTCPLH